MGQAKPGPAGVNLSPGDDVIIIGGGGHGLPQPLSGEAYGITTSLCWKKGGLAGAIWPQHNNRGPTISRGHHCFL